jgi:hypothetical protein
LIIQEYVTNLAEQMGIQLSKISLVEGRSLGCFDASILNLESCGKLVSEYIHQSECEDIKAGTNNDMLDLKVRAALERLKLQIAP